MKYSNKITESRLPSREDEGPGPGEYNVIKPIIKPTFNRGTWKPHIPSGCKPSSTRSKVRVRTSTNRSKNGGVSLGHPNVSVRIVEGSSRARSRSPSIVDTANRRRTSSFDSDARNRMRTSSFGSSGRLSPTELTKKSSVNQASILHDQRKKAATMLRNLIQENNKQLKVPILKILEALEKVKLFAVLNVDQLRRLSYLLDEEEYPVNSYIIRQGDDGDKFYIIVSGTVKCTINQEDGGELTVIELGAFDYFGEKAILESAPRAANVISTEHVKVLYIKKIDFESVFGKLAELIKKDAMMREENSPTRVNYDVWANSQEPPLSPLPKKSTDTIQDHGTFNEILHQEREQHSHAEETVGSPEENTKSVSLSEEYSGIFESEVDSAVRMEKERSRTPSPIRIQDSISTGVRLHSQNHNRNETIDADESMQGYEDDFDDDDDGEGWDAMHT